MKEFKTISVVKNPRTVVWSTIRDRLSDLAPMLADIEAIVVQSRADAPNGAVHLVNLWKAKVTIPTTLSSVIQPDMLAWIDRAEWQADHWECHWQIQPHFFEGRIQCKGVTRYEEAMAGRGTRLTFQGNLHVPASSLPGVSSLIESFAIGLIPKNFQKLTHAVSQHLEAETH